MTQNEHIVTQARIHWVVFVAPAILTILAVLASIFFDPIMGWVFLFITLYPLYNAVVQYMMTNLILTDKKVLYRAGFLSRDWVRMDFDKIENSYLEEPIIGRQLGYSTIVISGVGSGAINVRSVANGDKFIQALEQKLSGHKLAVTVN